MRQGPRPAVPDNAVMINNLLKLGGGCRALSSPKISLATNVSGIEAGEVVREPHLSVLDGRPQSADRACCILAVQRQLGVNGGQPQRLRLGVERVALVQVLR
jgi:hypothetical protein